MTYNTISLYAIVRDADQRFFGGFDPDKGEALIVDDVTAAKLFSNKFDVKLRPDEKMVEVIVTLAPENVHVTTPFRPRLKVPR